MNIKIISKKNMEHNYEMNSKTMKLDTNPKNLQIVFEMILEIISKVKLQYNVEMQNEALNSKTNN